MKTLLLTSQLRQRLKNPLGELIRGTTSVCNHSLTSVIQKESPTKVVLVGDGVSRNAIQSGIRPDIIIVDNKEMRRDVEPFVFNGRRRFRLANAQGSISSASWDIIHEAIGIGNSVVVVEGEEDLLTLVAITESPLGSLVVYGQPNVGIVLVRVSPEKKQEITQLIKLMDEST